MHGSSRRGFLRASGAVAAAPVLAPLFGSGAARAQAGSVLTIAYNTTLPGWDPTSSAHTANPVVQSIFKSVFDQYVDQNPDLSFKPGILTRWEFPHPDPCDRFVPTDSCPRDNRLCPRNRTFLLPRREPETGLRFCRFGGRGPRVHGHRRVS